MASKPWGGRFGEKTDRRVEEFTESISFDRRLFEHDIRGSVAHAEMLASVNLITDDECRQIVRGLSEIRAEIEAGTFPFVLDREDVHMHVEAALIEKLGDTGRKLHTARSRNDQVATDAKLWTRDALDRVDARLVALQRALVGSAGRHRGVILPGYTHMQRAQPVLAAHYFLAYAEKFERDRGRVADARKRLNVLPLGAAALAGTSLPIDRDHVARALGFDGVAANSMDVSSDRDFALESVFALTLIATHLSGWAEEWVIWSTQEFSFLALPDAICTGSSIMPQKKNPDVLELIRGRSARVVGALNTLLVLVKGLPLAYNRDLQEDKEPLFDAFDTVEACLDLAALVVAGARLRGETIEARLDEGFLDATTLMEYLIQKGVPQRSAHEIIGHLVGLCEARGLRRLADLPDAEFVTAHPAMDHGVKAVLGVANAVKAFRSYGSTAPAEVERQLSDWEGRFGPPPETLARPTPVAQCLFDTAKVERLADWQAVVGKKNWRAGYSAYELAHSWHEDKFRMPDAVKEIFRRSTFETFHELTLVEGSVEKAVYLDTKKAPSRTDLMAYCRNSRGDTVVLGVEGKARESFGPVVKSWIRDKGPEPIPTKRRRLEFLNKKLGLDVRKTPIGVDSELRYQLLHRTTSVVLEGVRRGAAASILLIHSFADHDSQWSDYQAFVKFLGFPVPSKNTLVGPVNLGEGKGIAVYCGWVADKPRLKNAADVSV